MDSSTFTRATGRVFKRNDFIISAVIGGLVTITIVCFCFRRNSSKDEIKESSDEKDTNVFENLKAEEKHRTNDEPSENALCQDEPSDSIPTQEQSDICSLEADGLSEKIIDSNEAFLNLNNQSDVIIPDLSGQSDQHSKTDLKTDTSSLNLDISKHKSNNSPGSKISSFEEFIPSTTLNNSTILQNSAELKSDETPKNHIETNKFIDRMVDRNVENLKEFKPLCSKEKLETIEDLRENWFNMRFQEIITKIEGPIKNPYDGLFDTIDDKANEFDKKISNLGFFIDDFEDSLFDKKPRDIVLSAIDIFKNADIEKKNLITEYIDVNFYLPENMKEFVNLNIMSSILFDRQAYPKLLTNTFTNVAIHKKIATMLLFSFNYACNFKSLFFYILSIEKTCDCLNLELKNFETERNENKKLQIPTEIDNGLLKEFEKMMINFQELMRNTTSENGPQMYLGFAPHQYQRMTKKILYEIASKYFRNHLTDLYELLKKREYRISTEDERKANNIDYVVLQAIQASKKVNFEDEFPKLVNVDLDFFLNFRCLLEYMTFQQKHLAKQFASIAFDFYQDAEKQNEIISFHDEINVFNCNDYFDLKKETYEDFKSAFDIFQMCLKDFKDSFYFLNFLKETDHIQKSVLIQSIFDKKLPQLARSVHDYFSAVECAHEELIKI